jgi:maltose/moltooligosaccharide transporter
MSDTSGSSHVTLLKLVGFAMGLFAVQTFWGFTWATLPLYLKELTSSNVVTGIILSTTGITGLFFPVLAGWVSDRINTPLGRRRPLIIAGWCLACIMILLLMRIDSLLVALPVIVLAYAGFFFAIGPYFALLPDTVPVAQRSFASGIMFLVGGTGMLSYLMFAARLWDTSHTRPFVWVVIAIFVSVAIMCFSVREARAHGPINHQSLLKGLADQKNLWRFLIGFTLQWVGMWMVSAFFVISCMVLFGLSVERAVQAFFVLNASFVLFALPAGLLATKLGLKRTTIFGVALLIACFCCIPFTKEYPTLLFFMVITGAGYGTVQAVSYPFFLSLVPEGNTAGFVGLYMACQNGTLLVGPVIAGFMIDRFGYVTLFYGAAAVMLAGAIMYMTMRNPEKKAKN